MVFDEAGYSVNSFDPYIVTNLVAGEILVMFGILFSIRL